MTEYKLLYFDAKGLGEPIRFILSYMGKEFQDNRISYDEWVKDQALRDETKEHTPFGKLPTLEVDGKLLHQSLAILRYLAEQAGLAGNNLEENLEIEMVAGAYGDLAAEASRCFRTENENEKQKLKETLINETIPFYMSKFENILKNNGGYLANGKLSWAELYVVGHSSSLPGVLGFDLNEKYPFWKELTERVQSQPGIKEWVQKRPKSFY